MKEEEPNWFARWEEELPSPEELMPLTQTLITPDLALAFDIPSPESAAAAAGADFLRRGINNQHHHHGQQKVDPAFPPSSQPSPAQSQGPPSQLQQHPLSQAAGDYDSSDLGGAGSGGGGGAGSGGDDQARTLKRPRLVWTPQLHKRFVDAVAHLGIKNAVPKTIMQLMSVEGLTRENVASHLQKYRLYLKRMQGLSGGPGGAVGQLPHADQATEQLFASGPVPHPLLHHRGPTPAPVGGGGVGTPDQFFPFASMGSLHPHQPQSHQQQMAAAAAAAAAAANYHQRQQYYQPHRQQQQMLGSPTGNGFEHGFLGGRQQQPPHQHHPAAAMQRMMGPVSVGMGAATGFGGSPFAEDLDSGGGGGERMKELTLFPTNEG